MRNLNENKVYEDLTDSEKFEVDWGFGCWKWIDSIVIKEVI